ncbi:complement C1q-like protein 4 [Mytilus trossulus]|uniref:complement C1q-like protein 4 n=1 Tax=Mytilus trossulus TaxID=6551 RepID=UPI0030056BCA
MMWYLVLAIIIFRINFLDVEGNYNPGHGKTISITEDLFHTLMKKLSSSSKCECKDSNTRTAFTAILKTNIRVNVNYVFKFDEVKVNQGNNYNLYTGEFTAPRDGLYYFSCTIQVNRAGNKYFYLMKNSSIYLRGYIVNTNYGSQTKSVIMDLDKGDHVYVKSGSKYNVQKQYSYFSGYLL